MIANSNLRLQSFLSSYNYSLPKWRPLWRLIGGHINFNYVDYWIPLMGRNTPTRDIWGFIQESIINVLPSCEAFVYLTPNRLEMVVGAVGKPGYFQES